MLVKQCKKQLTHTHTETNPTFQCDWTLQIQPTKNKLIKRKCPFCWRDLFSFFFTHTSHANLRCKFSPSPAPVNPAPSSSCADMLYTHTNSHTRKKNSHTHTRSTRIIKWNNTESNKTMEENSGRKSWKTRKKLNTNKFKENQVRIL